MASPQGASKHSAPFPPGLEPEAALPASSNMLEEAANEMRAVAIESIDQQLNQIGDSGDREAIIVAVRKVVLAEVDSKVQEKAEELWKNGKKMLASIQTKHKEKTQALSDDLAECLKKQKVLEEDNEKLKTVLQGLAIKFNMLGSVFSAAPKTGAGIGGVTGVHGAPGDLSTVASTMSPNQDSASQLFSPATLTPGAAETSKDAESGASTNFADVPDFPFPAPAPALSLAEHLLQSPQPLSLASSLESSPEGQENSSNSFTFSFTLRKADGADLGLNVSHHEHDRVLRVEGVRPEGAVEAWNRQCASSAFAEKAVLAGDIISSVNNIMYDPKKMLEECRDRQLLKLTVHRQRTPSKPTTLRAEASEFVPLRAEASEFVPGVAAAAPSASTDDEKQAAVVTAAADAVEGDVAKPEV